MGHFWLLLGWVLKGARKKEGAWNWTNPLLQFIQKELEDHGENGGSEWLEGKIPRLQILLELGRVITFQQERRPSTADLEVLQWKTTKEKRDLHNMESKIFGFIRNRVRILWFSQTKDWSHLCILPQEYNPSRIHLHLWLRSDVHRFPPWIPSVDCSGTVWRHCVSLRRAKQAQKAYLLVQREDQQAHWPSVVSQVEPRHFQELQLLLDIIRWTSHELGADEEQTWARRSYPIETSW